MFAFTFYFFSFILAYFDCKRRLVPNIILVAQVTLLALFGYFDAHIAIYSLLIPLFILFFFVIILLIKPSMILGGGDIKYMMVAGFYLEPLLFPFFLLISGIVQMLFLIFFQKFKKRRTAPMVPAMLIAAAVSEAMFIMEVI